MAHPIPKLEYGDVIPTTISFDYPPKEDGGELYDAVEHVSTSLSGQRQVSIDYVEVTRKLKFSFLTEALKTSMETFFSTHGYLSKTFKYFDDKLSVTYKTWELAALKFAPKKIAPKGIAGYVWEIDLTFRRVMDAVAGDFMTATIANNQAVAANITGLLFDATAHTSAKVFYTLKRTTDSSERVCTGYISAFYRAATTTWELGPAVEDGDSVLMAVALTITGAGQVKYTSDNQSGTNYAGTIEYRVLYID